MTRPPIDDDDAIVEEAIQEAEIAYRRGMACAVRRGGAVVPPFRLSTLTREDGVALREWARLARRAVRGLLLSAFRVAVSRSEWCDDASGCIEAMAGDAGRVIGQEVN
jgi:hypothetical protein